MILKSIKINNFLSHSDTEISLSDNQKFLLDGKSGVGKSSILDSLVWALYGKGRTENRSLIKKGKKYARTMVVLKDKNETEYSITRSITDTGKHDLLVTYKKVTGKRFLPVEASGIKNLQEYIEKQILHSSYLLFINSVVCLQNSNDSFVEQTAARRKEIILEIVNASDYDEYYAKAKDKVRELEIVTEGSEIAITGITNKLIEDKKRLVSLPALEIELKNSLTNEHNKKKELEIILEKKSEINIVASKKSEKDKELVIVYDKIQKLIIEIESLNQKKESLSFSNNDKDSLKEDIGKKKNELVKLMKLVSKRNIWNEQMMELINSAPVDINYEETEKRLNSQIIGLMRRDIAICPEVNKACPVIVKERDLEVVRLSVLLDETIKEKKEYIEKRADYDKKINDLGEKPIIDNVEFSELEYSVLKLEKRLKEVESGTMDIMIEISVKEKEKDLRLLDEKRIGDESEKLGLELDMLTIEYSEENRKKLEEEYNNLVSRGQAISQKIAITKNEIERIEKEEKTLESMKKNIKDDQETLKSMKLLKEALGNNGIKAIVIDYVIPRLEDRINAILGKLSDFRVRLDTQTRSVSGESMKEGLYIDILTPEGEQLSYENFSGGEKVKISSAIFEGLASFQKCKFRFLDESIVALDGESTRQFIDVVKDVQKNVDQLIVISHIQEIKDYFVDKVNVVKKDGNSFIE